MMFFDKALKSLGITGLCYTGSIRTEEDFLKNAYKLTGNVDDNGEGILSRNPDDFGVTWKQIEDQIKIEEKEYSDTQYQRDRKEEYDKLNQLELQFDDQANDTTTWVDAIEAIKAKYPKP